MKRTHKRLVLRAERIVNLTLVRGGVVTGFSENYCGPGGGGGSGDPATAGNTDCPSEAGGCLPPHSANGDCTAHCQV